MFLSLFTACDRAPKCQQEFFQETVRAADGVEYAGEDHDADIPLLTVPKSYVEELEMRSTVVDCERVEQGEARLEVEAPACPPAAIRTRVPDDFKPGETITVEGPHGPVQVPPPPEARLGGYVTFRLAPPAQFRAKVPPGKGPGDSLLHTMKDGTRIELPIPPGVEVGETFEVGPPSAMVKVPDGVTCGTAVVFKDPSDEFSSEWLRAKVPYGLKPGDYFSARLPAPIAELGARNPNRMPLCGFDVTCGSGGPAIWTGDAT
eukprot:TRINITY_DN63967_c0_g1_i1.p1 TRINITY_DN63967_c0_g1~~TRINITY_DN63967_c0_g1_i1.p1  ORF type:complete len:261 (-),score=49.21 TRINITY_DN63967_c0_g1_i1:171-953(-)